VGAGIDSVQSSIPLFLFTGQFVFRLNESQYQLFNLAMANYQKHFCSLNSASEALTRASWGYYTVEELKRIFNHVVSALAFASPVRLPTGNHFPGYNGATTSTVFGQMYRSPVEFSVCHLTGLVFFELHHQIPDKSRILQVLHNLRSSILNSQAAITRESTLFWGLYHLLKVEAVFGFHRAQLMGLIACDPIVALIQEQETWNQIHLSLTLSQCVGNAPANQTNFH
jgi:hypothetical protein